MHTRKVPLSTDVDVSVLARSTPGFTGADLENLVNEAALLAARNDKEKVDMLDLELAKDKVMMGAERRSMIISDEEKRNTAYHEAGHALSEATAWRRPDSQSDDHSSRHGFGSDAATAHGRKAYLPQGISPQ